MGNEQIHTNTDGMQKSEGSRNDLFRIADMYSDDPQFAEGAEALRSVASALIESGSLPGEIILSQGEDSELLRERAPIEVYPHFVFDRENQTVKCEGSSSIQLRRREHRMLDYLSGKPGVVVSTNELLREVYGPEARDIGLVKSCISFLRGKLPITDGDGNHAVIATVYGRGYRFISGEEERQEKWVDMSKTSPNKEVLALLHCEFIPEDQGIRIDGKFIPLTFAETRILEALVKANGLPIADEELFQFLIPRGRTADNLKTHISHIRKKIIAGRELGQGVIERIGGEYRLITKDNYETSTRTQRRLWRKKTPNKVPDFRPDEVSSESVNLTIMDMLDRLMDDDQYSEGAMDLADHLAELIEQGKLPKDL